MKFQTKFQIDLIVRSFAYVAKKLALSPCNQHEQILNEAERHRQALRLLQRDVFELTSQKLREQALTETASTRRRKATARAVEQAQATLTRVAAQYAPHKLAA
jgi:hypothetical protein